MSQVDNNMETPLDCAKLLGTFIIIIIIIIIIIYYCLHVHVPPDANIRQGTGSGVLIAVPIPMGVACEGVAVEDAIQVALREAE